MNLNIELLSSPKIDIQSCGLNVQTICSWQVTLTKASPYIYTADRTYCRTKAKSYFGNGS